MEGFCRDSHSLLTSKATIETKGSWIASERRYGPEIDPIAYEAFLGFTGLIEILMPVGLIATLNNIFMCSHPPLILSASSLCWPEISAHLKIV